jgi:hypothetical protein
VRDDQRGKHAREQTLAVLQHVVAKGVVSGDGGARARADTSRISAA